jgi:hypothetical protein
LDKANESRLSSWKEIADYLGSSEKTCRRREKENGLPIYRLDGEPNSSVYAYKTELDAWFRQRGSKTAASEAQVKATSAILARNSRTKWFVAGGILCLISGLGVALGLTAHAGQASNFGIDGSVLRILNKAGRDTGRFDTGLPALEKEGFYRDRFQVRTLNEENVVKWPTILIQDINNDGEAEVVFSTQTKTQYGEGHLYCLNRRGEKLWEFQAGSRRRYGTSTISADFMIEGISTLDLDGDGNLELCVIGAHVDDPPTQLAVLDHNGQLIGEYWNFGRLIDLAIADIDADGQKELLVVGTNNEYGKACLIAFDPGLIEGCSPQIGEEFINHDSAPGTELVYMLFPRTEVDLAEYPDRESMRWVNIMENGRIKLMTIHSGLQFELDGGLTISAVKQTVVYQNKRDQYLREGRIKPGVGNGDVELLKRGGLYWNLKLKQWSAIPETQSRKSGARS